MNRPTSEPPGSGGKIIDLNSRRALRKSPHRDSPGRILRIAPENDGLRTLYSNDLHREHLIALDIIGWALHESGEVAAIVPWLKDVVSATSLADPLNGQCEGYWDPWGERLLPAPPPHKIAELQSSLAFFGVAANDHSVVVQSIPDSPGTHAVMSADGFRTVNLLEVVGWQLRGDGRVLGLLADGEQVVDTPVLASDNCVYAAQEHAAFRYFFQHGVANQIKRHEPEALACLAILAGGGVRKPE